MPKFSPADLDLENRDPNNLNDDTRVMFEDVIGEPEGAHSIECCWKINYSVFTCSKWLWYNVLTICCSCPLALFWGFEFAEIAFLQIWQFTPYYRALSIYAACSRKYYATILDCCLGPCCETMGLFFSKIKVQQ